MAPSFLPCIVIPCTVIDRQGVYVRDEDDEGSLVSTSGSIIKLYYSPLRTALPDGETGLIGESPKLLVGVFFSG